MSGFLLATLSSLTQVGSCMRTGYHPMRLMRYTEGRRSQKMTDSTALATTNGATVIPRLDPYSAGIAAEAPRVDALAVISCGYRGEGSGNRPGLPKSSRAGDAKQIHIHDPEHRAPGLAAAVEAGAHRRLTIAFPLDDPRQFIVQRFTRYSASRLEAY